ncbi:MAG: septal ring lytic transglycosylase RlpA family protein [Bryobacteraceae bacterium]
MRQPQQKLQRAILAATLAALALLSGCRRHHRVVRLPSAPHPSAPRASSKPSFPIGYTKVGIASWYGIPFDGHRAADGEIFHKEDLVAANRILPFNTWLKVTYLANGKSVNVRVIDRGPFVHGRMIDLSMAAARKIGLLGPGIGRVRIEVIAAPAENPATDFYAVQVGAFSVRAHAERMEAAYARKYSFVRIAEDPGRRPLWRVLVGKERSLASAKELAAKLRKRNKKVFLVRFDFSDLGESSGDP